MRYSGSHSLKPQGHFKEGLDINGCHQSTDWDVNGWNVHALERSHKRNENYHEVGKVWTLSWNELKKWTALEMPAWVLWNVSRTCVYHGKHESEMHDKQSKATGICATISFEMTSRVSQTSSDRHIDNLEWSQVECTEYYICLYTLNCVFFESLTGTENSPHRSYNLKTIRNRYNTNELVTLGGLYCP